MNAKARLLALVVTVALPTLVVVGCGGDTSVGPIATGGAPASHPDGGTATGGTSSTGGNPGTGGIAATGGDGTGGGDLGSGGAVVIGGNSGGNSGGGGNSGTGGTATDGGIASTGGNRDAGAGGATTGDAGSSDGAGPDGATTNPGGKITVWLSGDSTMQPCNGACPCGWGSQFQPLFNSDVTVVNDGVGGRSIQTWLYESSVTNSMSGGECVVNPKTYASRWQDMLTRMKAGDYLLIEFGINDGDSTCPRHVGTALFQTYLGTMAAAAQQKGAHAILLTSTSSIACGNGATVNPNRAFGPQTMAAAVANNVPMIDLTRLSAELYTRLGFCPGSLDYGSTTSPVGKFFCADHTHFEAAGAAQIAGVVAKALRDQNIPLAAYLK